MGQVHIEYIIVRELPLPPGSLLILKREGGQGNMKSMTPSPGSSFDIEM